jgi:hypothetical protein
MRRFWTTLGVAVVALVLGTPDALAMHSAGGTTPSGGFPWDTVLIWGAIGVGIVLVLAWIAVEGRRHHWHLPHRPVHA